MQEKSKKRILVKIITAILIAVVWSILPQQANAIGLSAAGIAKSIFTFVANLAIGIGGFLVKLAAFVFESMLNLSFSTDYKAVAQLAWTPVRDFANMFFILIMMVVAFATILKIEQYGIRKLLPKVIGIALLINFSLVMCYVIIDFSNLTAKSFINAAKNEATSLGNTKSSISAALSDSFKITKVLMPNKDCAKTLEDDLKECESSNDPETCKTNAQAIKTNCDLEKGATGELTGWDKVVSVVITGILGSIILIVAAFVLLAGAIMLIIRIVAIWILVPLAPIVFICYLVPGLQNNWRKWWSAFINWCVFAPAYAFFIWLAVKISVGKKLLENITLTEIDPALNANPSTISSFFNSGQNFIHFAFTLGILLGGLIMAKQLGIAGANTAMAIGQKWAKGARNASLKWSGSRAKEIGAKPMQGVSNVMAKIPGFRKLAQLPAKTMVAQQKSIEEEKKKLGSYSPDTLKSLYKGFNRTQQVAAAQILAEKGKLSAGKSFRENDIDKIIKTANIYSATGDMLKNRPDLAHITEPELTKQQAIDKYVAKLNVADGGKIQEEALTPEVLDAIFRSQNGAFIAKIAESNIKSANKIQEAINNLSTDRDPKIRVVERYVKLEKKNPRLANYIDKTASQGAGFYTFEG